MGSCYGDTTPNTLTNTTILVNLVLWISYWMVGYKKSDFGKTPKHLHVYMVVCALAAYLANLWYVFIIASKDVPSETITIVMVCVLCYYILQMFFIPLVRATQAGYSKWWVRALLIICVIPMSVLAGIGVRSGDCLLGVLGIITVLHVLINDALLYGYLF